jgi:hypothetical protein
MPLQAEHTNRLGHFSAVAFFVLSVGYAYGLQRLIGVSFSRTALGLVVRREQTYWKPEALASQVAVVITKSLQTKPQLPPILVLVLFVLSYLLSGLSCPYSACAAAVKRTIRMTRMVRTDVIANNVRACSPA